MTAIAADTDSGERGEADETDEWLRNYDPMATCYYDRYVPKHPEFYHDVYAWRAHHWSMRAARSLRAFFSGEGASAAALAGGYPAHMRHLMALDSAFTSLFERPIHWAAVGSDR